MKHNMNEQDNKTSKDDYMTPHRNTRVLPDTSTGLEFPATRSQSCIYVDVFLDFQFIFYFNKLSNKLAFQMINWLFAWRDMHLSLLRSIMIGNNQTEMFDIKRKQIWNAFVQTWVFFICPLDNSWRHTVHIMKWLFMGKKQTYSFCS